LEKIDLHVRNCNLAVSGFPDAEKVVAISGPKARWLADLALHREDLNQAHANLHSINTAPVEDQVVRDALWRNAIILFCKCFGQHNSRGSLTLARVFGQDTGAVEAFRYFDALRNKHLVHDESPYTQCAAGAVLNKEGSSCKIAKVLCIVVTGNTLEQENWSNLHLLIATALHWVTNEFDKTAASITQDYEQMAQTDLMALPDANFKNPKDVELNSRRLRP
jgi:hypothetical protein